MALVGIGLRPLGRQLLRPGNVANERDGVICFRRCASGRKQLVILGTGWAGFSLLRRVDKKLYDVIVVSPRNHFLFTPLLASTTVGTLEFRSIVEPVRNAGFRDEHHFHLSHAVKLDPEQHALTCRSVLDDHEYKINYDKLVIAVGAVPNTFGIPGVEKHAFFLKEINDARAIRRRLLHNLELSVQPGVSQEERYRLLHIVIVGGGPTGIEFGAEMYDFVQQDVQRLYRHGKDAIRVTIVEAAQILPSFDRELQQYAETRISQRSQMELVRKRVTKVEEDGVVLADGSKLRSGLVVWSTGVGPRPFTKSVDSLKKNGRQQIVVDEYLRCVGEGRQDIYAIGDCSHIQNNPLPCTAQVADRAGQYLAKSLSSDAKNKRVDPFTFNSLGMLAYVGEHKALADTPSFKKGGFYSWIFWRSVYATRLSSWRLRLQVVMDWTKTFLFGRDTSRFG